ncbi:hypothetical protein ACFSC4_00025 [Deinococcus malanensis]|uniref:hypothetical protein n=1 Tax=Deinococcus malanensis TaxID=1706855 RepID=UPI00363F1931
MRNLNARLLRTPNDRVSREPNDLSGLLSSFEDSLAGYPQDTRRRIILVLRALAENDDDVSGSLSDLQALCGAGFTIDFTGGTRAMAQAKAELDAWQLTMFPEGGGLQGLISNLVGRSPSLERPPASGTRNAAGVGWLVWPWCPGRGPDPPGPGDPAAHPRADRPGERHSTPSPDLPVRGPRTTSRSPYGVPLYIAALFALDRKRQLLLAEQRVINLMARSALVKATAPIPTPDQLGCSSEDDPGYTDAVAEYFNALADTIVSGSENGVYIGPHGTEISVVPINQTASGAPEITKGNQKRVWNALKSLPFMRGEMDSTTQALAQVTVPILHAQAISVNHTIARQLEFGMNLHLSLRGIPAQAWVRFTPPASPFQLDEATALLRKAEAHEKLAALFGPAWAAQAMREFDVEDGDAGRAPDWWNPSTGPTLPTDPGGTP